MEHHEVGGEDLVHAPQRLKAVQIVLGRLGFEVTRLAGEMTARRMDVLALGLQHARDRILREPVDLEIGMQAAKLAGDRHVAAHVPEPDRR